jgi:ABC-type uncharacterized transport system substrate-binding protein
MLRSLIAFAFAALAATAAEAHPHVFIDAREELVFDGDGKMSGIRHIWQFDPAFTSYAVQGLDANGDNELSDEELQPLAKVNVESLKEFHYFTRLKVNGLRVPVEEPSEYWLDFHDGRLTLFYTLPLKTPTPVGPDTTLEVFDPSYFVAFNFLPGQEIALTGAPDGCKGSYVAPKELDENTMAMLSAIPADQADLPDDLADIAATLASRITIACS